MNTATRLVGLAGLAFAGWGLWSLRGRSSPPPPAGGAAPEVVPLSSWSGTGLPILGIEQWEGRPVPRSPLTLDDHQRYQDWASNELRTLGGYNYSTLPGSYRPRAYPFPQSPGHSY